MCLVASCTRPLDLQSLRVDLARDWRPRAGVGSARVVDGAWRIDRRRNRGYAGNCGGDVVRRSPFRTGARLMPVTLIPVAIADAVLAAIGFWAEFTDPTRRKR